MHTHTLCVYMYVAYMSLTLYVRAQVRVCVCVCGVPYLLPEYVMVASMLLSAGGAHLPHIACIAGNVTPYKNENNMGIARGITVRNTPLSVSPIAFTVHATLF